MVPTGLVSRSKDRIGIAQSCGSSSNRRGISVRGDPRPSTLACKRAPRNRAPPRGNHHLGRLRRQGLRLRNRRLPPRPSWMPSHAQRPGQTPPPARKSGDRFHSPGPDMLPQDAASARGRWGKHARPPGYDPDFVPQPRCPDAGPGASLCVQSRSSAAASLFCRIPHIGRGRYGNTAPKSSCPNWHCLIPRGRMLRDISQVQSPAPA